MQRRTYLTAVGSGLALFAGCSDSSATETPTDTATTTAATETPTMTPEPTEEPTPEPTATPEPAPMVTDAGLLVNRGELGALDSDIDSVGQGGSLVIGTEYELPVDDGSVSGLVEATVYDSADSELQSNTLEVDDIVQGDQAYQSQEAWFAFETTSWDLGSYTAEVLVRSNSYETTSETTVVDFDIVEPLGAGEVEIERVDPSDQVFVEEDVAIEFSVTNVSDRDSTLLAESPTVEYETGDSAELSISYIQNIPAGEAVTLTTTEISFNVAGTYTFRLDEQDAAFTFTVEEN